MNVSSGLCKAFAAKTSSVITVLDILSEKFSWDYWCRVDEEHSCVRFCTSWATTDEYVEALEAELEKFTCRTE